MSCIYSVANNWETSFLPDIAITVAYIVWMKFKERDALLNLIILIILSLSIKNYQVC